MKRRDGEPCDRRGPAAEIALVHYTAPPVVGGVEYVLGKQAVLMAAAGHSVRIVAGRGQAPDPRVRFESVSLADSMHPEVLAVGTELAAGRVTPAFSALVHQLEADIRAALAGTDVAILHNVASLDRNLALSVALRGIADRPGSPRFILWHHDMAWTLPFYRPALHEGAPWSLLRTVWPGAIQVTISEARRRDLAALLGIPAASITVVPGGVDLPEIRESGPRTLNLPGGVALTGLKPLLLTPARVTPRKNIELAIEVVGALRRMGLPAGLIVTGPADPHDATGHLYLERLVELRRRLGLEASVLFLAVAGGEAPSREQLDDLYAASDVLFLPSRDEGFGLPMLEAAVHRLPIVCSDLPALRELGGDGAVFIAPDADPRDAADAVLAAIARGPSADLSRRVEAEYSWPGIYRRAIEPLLARALASP